MKLTNQSVIALLWGLLYLATGYVSHQLNGPIAATGYIWLPAGVTVAAFMLTKTGRWLPVAIGFVLAQLLLGWIEDRNLLRVALFALDEIGVAAIVVALVRMLQLPMEGLHFVRGLLIAGVACSAISAAIGAAWYLLVQQVPFWPTARIWAASDLVGILIVTPVLAGWSRFHAMRSGGMDRSDFLLGLAAFVALGATAFIIFDGHGISNFSAGVNFALTYVPLFFVAVVTLLWGGRGGSLAVAMLAFFALLNTVQGEGPFAAFADTYSKHSLLEAQLYLAVAALLSLLISALKTTREQLHEDAAQWKNDTELALTASRQLVYNIDPHSKKLCWHGDLQGLLGVTNTAFSDLDQVLAHVHPDDRQPLRSRWLDDTDDDTRPDLSFRLLLPAGEQSQVTDMSAVLLDADESVAMVAGAWRLNLKEDARQRGRI
ncbi:Integral membrane sensor domain MASE1 [Collimonas sp. OK607]|uniref:MASE1 domain-containing protein n=1 Tax=Collimonas sp. OK607 TaxID=1798194 RepID=UPI0008E5CF32|nr:MASE1 domain-containing protein [Collimonas sp. OK607]SFB11124.1 Integral membrane sensor domain MASE1 [Collimonas sp. OK607]